MSAVISSKDQLFHLYVANLRTEHPIPAVALAKQQLEVFQNQTKGESEK